MRLWEFDDHPAGEFSEDDYDAIAEKIHKNCSQILSVYQRHKDCLKRGISNKSPAFFAGKPRMNRVPLNSSSVFQHLFDLSLQQLGYEARRGNSIFVTSDYEMAEGFGTMYYIFPANGFKFTYSETQKDVILKRSHTIDRVFDAEDTIIPIARKMDAAIDEGDHDAMFILERVNQVLKWYYTAPMNNFAEVIQAKRAPDIIIAIYDLLWNGRENKVNKFIGSKEQLTQKLLNPKKLEDYLSLNNEDLDHAMTSGNEVYIRGAFYAMRAPYVAPLLDRLNIPSWGI